MDKLTHQEELKIIGAIAKRAVELALENDLYGVNQSDFFMVIDACHSNGNPLRLREFLDADDSNFIHDAFGIMKNLDKETSKLANFFSPRYSVPDKQIKERINESIVELFNPNINH